jgi:hypothetical protein
LAGCSLDEVAWGRRERAERGAGTCINVEDSRTTGAAASDVVVRLTALGRWASCSIDEGAWDRRERAERGAV